MISRLFGGFAASLIFSSMAAASLCEKHPIYCHIKNLRPSLPNRAAMELSNHIFRNARRFHINPRVAVAIAYQENRFRDTVVKHYRHGKLVSVDVGVWQLSVRTIGNYNKQFNWNIDRLRLEWDLDYQTAVAFRIMRRKQRICSKRGWAVGSEWSCYHSFTRKHRMEYERDVKRWL